MNMNINGFLKMCGNPCCSVLFFGANVVYISIYFQKQYGIVMCMCGDNVDQCILKCVVLVAIYSYTTP